MDLFRKYRSPLGYFMDDEEKRKDSYGVDHSGFSTRDELEYQTARSERENELIQNYNNQGITKDYPQQGTNFWGNPENNYGFGNSNISANIESRKQNQTSLTPQQNQMQNSFAFGNNNQNQMMTNNNSQANQTPSNNLSGNNNGLNNNFNNNTNNNPYAKLKQWLGQSEQNINSALYPKPRGDDANSYQLAQNNKTNTMTDANNSFSLTSNLNSNNNKNYLSSNKLSSSQDSSYKQGEEQYQQLKSLGNNSSAITNQSNAWDKNTRQDQNELPDISTLGHYSNNTNPNQTVIPEKKQMSMISTRPTLSQWLKDVNTKPMTMNGSNMNGQERIKALKDGQSIVINVEDTDIPQESNANEHLHNWGKEEVDKYGNLIEKYANQYNLDPNMAKAILYTEASDYHKYGLDSIADKLGVSTSVRPMNIQGKTWGNFQGQRYDVKNPEQNIELGVRILKAIYDAVPDKDVTKIATLWNGTGLRNINEYGKKAQEYYLNQSWNAPYEMPQLENK